MNQTPSNNPEHSIHLASNKVSQLNNADAKWHRYRVLIARHWWLLLLLACLGACYMAWKTYSKPIEYTCYAQLVAGGHFRGLQTGGPAFVDSRANEFYGTAIEILHSPEIAKKAHERVKNLHPDLQKCWVSPVIRRPAQTAVIRIIMKGREPEYTEKFLDSLLHEYMNYRQDAREEVTDGTLNSVTRELLRAEEALQEQEAKIQSFRETNNLLILNQKDNIAAEYLKKIQAQKSALDTELSLLNLLDIDADIERRSRSVQINDSELDPELYSLLNSGLGLSEKRYLEVKESLHNLKTDRDGLLRNFKGKHPNVVEINEKIQKESRNLANLKDLSLLESRRRTERLKLKLENLDNEIQKYEEEATEVGAKLAQYDSLDNVRTRLQKSYDKYYVMLEGIDADANLNSDFLSIQQPVTKARKQNPQYISPILTGLVLGGFGGLALAFLIDRVDDRMNSISEFTRHFDEEVVGQIPDQDFNNTSRLLVHDDSRHIYMEAFRNLRSTLLFKNWNGNSPKLIAITSSVPNEGKTTIATNLAFTLATSNARVLLVDADLRRGSIHKFYDLKSEPGLGDVLANQSDWSSMVRDTNVPNLSLLPRGKILNETAELLLSVTCTDMLEEMKKAYDYVIFDTAPVLVLDDTMSLAPHVDTTLFVVRIDSTTARSASKAMSQLYSRNVSIGGVILNRANTKLKEYSYYKYGNYYYKNEPKEAKKLELA